MERRILKKKVFNTKTTTNILKANPDTEVVVEGEEGIETLNQLARDSWAQGRDFEFQCAKLTFRRL